MQIETMSESERESAIEMQHAAEIHAAWKEFREWFGDEWDPTIMHYGFDNSSVNDARNRREARIAAADKSRFEAIAETVLDGAR